MDLTSERAYPTPYANSPLLPMLILSLMRQRHSPRVSRDFRDEYDYVIVGAGSAGSTVAGRLSEEACVNVLLLEAGKTPPILTEVPTLSASFFKSDISWKYKTVPQKNTAKGLVNNQIVWPSGKVLGGTSVFNGMQYVRGNHKNYNDWEAQGAAGWSYDDVLPYFKKLENNANIKDLDEGYHSTYGPVNVMRSPYQAEIKAPIAEAAKELGYRIGDSNGKRQTGFYDEQANMRDSQRCSTAKAYLVPAENRTNLDILTNAFVTRIAIRMGHAIGVIFEYENKTYLVRTKRDVIMSAGTVNTAQLLMLSGIGPRSHLVEFGIPVVMDLPVGENLQDHIATDITFELNPDITDIGTKLTNETNIAQYIESRSGPLSSAAAVSFIAFLNAESVSPSIDIPDFQIYFVEKTSSVYKELYGLKEEVYQQVFKPYEGKALMACTSQQLHPKSRGTVRLNSADPFDPPLIDPNYFDHPDDIKEIIKGLKMCKKIAMSEPLQKLGVKPLETLYPDCKQYAKDEDRYLDCQARSLIFTTNHQVSTAKMGDPKDPSTVVDPQLRVKGIEGLRVVDASVMPIIPSGNTNIPTIMLAEKASDIIKAEIDCKISE